MSSLSHGRRYILIAACHGRRYSNSCSATTHSSRFDMKLWPNTGQYVFKSTTRSEVLLIEGNHSTFEAAGNIVP